MRGFVLGLVALLALLLPMGLSGCARVTPTEQAALDAGRADHSAYVLPAGKLAEAESLSTERTALHFAGEIWGILVLWGLLQYRVVARIRNLAVNLVNNPKAPARNRWGQAAIFLLLLMFMTGVLSLPFAVAGHHLSVAYGLSVQGWGSWLWDQIKGSALTFVFGLLGVMLLYLLIRKFPRRWWVGAWLAMVVLMLLGVFAGPYVIDPLFNRFEPLQKSNPALVAELEKVVARGKGISIPPERMYLMHASDKVTTLNAYVTGFGASKRVVVWDTSVAKATPDEISYMFGHEMGHYVLGHITQGMEEAVVLLLVASYVGFLLFHWLLRRFGKQWRVPGQENWASLAVLLLVFSVLGLLAEPVGNGLSRAKEHDADVYGQEVVHGIVRDPQATGQAMFDLLGENSLSAPDPAAMTVFWDYSHPPIGERAGFAKHYDPWAAGAAPKYFRPEGSK